MATCDVTIPNWVPASVKTMADVIEIGKDVGRLLMTDPRMEAVWTTIRSQWNKQSREEQATRINGFPSLHRMATWGISDAGVSLDEQACAALFALVVIELGVPKEPVIAKDLRATCKSWRSAAKLCRAFAAAPGRPSTDPDLMQALLRSSEYIEDQVNFIEMTNKQKPYFLKRSTGRRGVADNAVRAKVRALACGTKALFGSYFYGTLAVTASVALNKTIEQKAVEDWCLDLPSQ